MRRAMRRMLRMGDGLPQINVHFDALSGHERFDIMGEVPVGPIGPAIGNAIYDAVGVRLRECPMTPEVILKAIEKKRREEG